jgi:uncharacterized protein
MSASSSGPFAMVPSVTIGSRRNLISFICRRRTLLQNRAFRLFFALLITLYLPVIFLWTGIIPFGYRFCILLPGLTGFLLYCARHHHSCRELGFRTDTLKTSFQTNLQFLITGVLGLLLMFPHNLFQPQDIYIFPHSYLIYFFFLAPIQEVVFRSLLFAEMKRAQITDERLLLIISTLSFCFLHLIYHNLPLLVISGISGYIWGVIYIRWPNIWSVTFSHSLLGALAMYLGVI